MSDALFLVPKAFTRVKLFEAREAYVMNKKAWELDAELSTPSLEDQVNAWLTDTADLVHSASSPSIERLELDETHMCYVRTVAVCYVPAKEGAEANDKQKQLQPKATQRGAPVGGTTSWSEAYGVTAEKAAAPKAPEAGGKTPKRTGQQMGRPAW